MSDYLKSLDSLLEKNNALIQEQRQIISAAQKEIQQILIKNEKIQQARALHIELGLSPGTESSPTAAVFKSLKQIIREEFSEVHLLTKHDLISRLYARGVNANEGTVGSTLSKMVAAGELEKAGHFAYRLKGESPVAAGLSSATKSEADDLI